MPTEETTTGPASSTGPVAQDLIAQETAARSRTKPGSPVLGPGGLIERKYARKARAPRVITEETRAKFRNNIAAAQAEMRRRRALRAIVEQKIKDGIACSPEELTFLKSKNSQRRTPEERERDDRLQIAKAAKVMINPKSILELRLLVEHTAAKHHYNPVEQLIIMAMDPASEMKESDRIAVHKCLLPYLAPVMPTPKDNSKFDNGVKVSITRFDFHVAKPADADALHTVTPVTVRTEETPA